MPSLWGRSGHALPTAQELAERWGHRLGEELMSLLCNLITSICTLWLCLFVRKIRGCMYLGEWSELELVFVPQGYRFDQLLLLLYVLAVEILQQNVLLMRNFKMLPNY